MGATGKEAKRIIHGIERQQSKDLTRKEVSCYYGYSE